jgi:hypothetical protein
MRMILAATLPIVPLLAKSNEPVERLDEAAAVFSEIMATPDKGIPPRHAGKRPLHRNCPWTENRS